MNPTHYPPAITPGFMNVKQPPAGVSDTRSYFQNFRNEHLSRMNYAQSKFNDFEIEYVPNPTKMSNDLDKFIRMPLSQFTMLDKGRQQDIDDFYMACQLHRDQYKDQTGKLHPLDYFQTSDYTYQCAPDPTSKYLKTPLKYVQYKSPQILPLTLERTNRSPMLPQRALTGRYDPISDIKYKR